MKTTLEEQAKEFIKENQDKYFSDDDRSGLPLYATKLELQILLRDFATAAVNAKLQEAAEKATVKFELDYNDDEIAVVDKESILSLTPKEETK